MQCSTAAGWQHPARCECVDMAPLSEVQETRLLLSYFSEVLT